MLKKSILLTGATGFLGSYLLNALISLNFNVIVIKRSTSNMSRIMHLDGRYKSYNIDIVHLEQAFEDQQIDCVIHTACNYGRNGESILSIVDSNLNLGIKLLDTCLKFKTESFINTDTLLPKNLNIYTLSKKQFVEYLSYHSNKLRVINLKLEHIYGPKDDETKFLPWLISQFNRNVSEIKLTKGEQKRDFIYIDDVVAAYITVVKALSSFSNYTELDVGTGELVPLNYFIQYLKECYECNFGSITSKLVFGAIPYRDGELMSVKVDNQGLLALGWRPTVHYKNGISLILRDCL